MRTNGTRGGFPLSLCAHTLERHRRGLDVVEVILSFRHDRTAPPFFTLFHGRSRSTSAGWLENEKKTNLQSEGRFTTGTLRNETKGQCEEMRWDDHRLSADFTAGLNTLNLRLGTFFWLIMVRERWDASWEQVCEERWEAGTGRRANTQQQYSGRRCSRCSATRLSGSDQDFVNVIKSKTWFLHNLKITGICSVHANKSWFCSEKFFYPY